MATNKKPAPARKPAPAKKPAPARKPAAKAARAVPKVSPLRGTPVGDYIDGLPSWQSAIVAALCDIVRAAAPEASVSIKWAQPVFELNGPFSYIKAASKHVNFGFWRGTELKAPAGLFDGDGVRMRHVKLTRLEDVETEVLADLVRAAAALNQKKGDPTRRK